eukprot:390606-Pyramimonas_sp.AAC.1
MRGKATALRCHPPRRRTSALKTHQRHRRLQSLQCTSPLGLHPTRAEWHLQVDMCHPLLLCITGHTGIVFPLSTSVVARSATIRTAVLKQCVGIPITG